MAFVAVNWVYFKILKIAFDKNLVDNPDARKLQKRPVPIMGGVAVFFGVLAGLLMGTVLYAIEGIAWDTHLLPVVCAMSLILYVGVMDDIMGLSPRARLIVEIMIVLGLIYTSGMCIDSFRHMWGVDAFSWWIAVPLTVVAGVGIINAVNMIDGVNGLSSGLCITCCIFFGVTFITVEDMSNAVLAFIMAAALVPFFIHNVFGQKSRMFIGDAGTMVMGILLTWFVICVLSSKSAVNHHTELVNVNMVALVLAILSVPVADTLRVMTLRILHRRSPFSPDKTHLHHVFIHVGVSHFITAMSEILIDIVIVLVWGACVLCGVSLDMQLYIVIITAMILVWGTYGVLRYHSRHHTKFLHWLTEYSVRTHLGRKEWWKKITAKLDYSKNEYWQETLDEANITYDVLSRHNGKDDASYKEQDRQMIWRYLKDRAEVYVQDIIENSGADKLRVYSILFEEIQEDSIVVVKAGAFGVPVIVAIKSDK